MAGSVAMPSVFCPKTGWLQGSRIEPRSSGDETSVVGQRHKNMHASSDWQKMSQCSQKISKDILRQKSNTQISLQERAYSLKEKKKILHSAFSVIICPKIWDLILNITFCVDGDVFCPKWMFSTIFPLIFDRSTRDEDWNDIHSYWCLLLQLLPDIYSHISVKLCPLCMEPRPNWSQNHVLSWWFYLFFMA